MCSKWMKVSKYITEIIAPLKLIKLNYVLYFSLITINCLVFPSMQMILSFAQKYLVNFVEYDDPYMIRKVYILSGLLIFILCFVKPFTGYLRDNLTVLFNTKLSETFYGHIEKLPLEFFDRTHSGEFISRFTNDLDHIASIYSTSIKNLLLAVFYGLSSIISMIFLCWQLAIFILFLGIFETWLITTFSQRIRNISDQIQKKTGLSNQRFMNIIQGFRVIKLFSLSNIMLEKYKHENILAESIKRNNTMLLMDVINNMFTSFNLLGVLSVGVLMLNRGYIDLGSVMAFLILQDGVTYMFSNISTFFPGLQGALASSQRVLEILHEPVEPEKPIAIKERQVIPHKGIYIDNLSFYYAENGRERNTAILKNITCKIEPSKTTAIVGPSGCGKTTLLKILLGLYQAQDGEIYLDGIRYRDYSLDEIRDSFSYVPQFPFLSHDTIAENIRLGNIESGDNAITDAAKAAYAHDLIRKMPKGYETIITEQGANLSGGEKQRIALARAICKNAKILVLDEATTGLDSESEAYIKKAIDHLVNAEYTVIVVAHRLSTIKNSDQIIVMDHGKIVHQGTYEELEKQEDRIVRWK